MQKIPKNPYPILKIRWLDACSHDNADKAEEGYVRETVGFLVRRGRKVVRVASTVDYTEGKGWVPSDQQGDIVDIPKGMILGEK